MSNEHNSGLGYGNFGNHRHACWRRAFGGTSVLRYARLIAAIWERTSNAARHTKEYLRCRDDFELYKKDVARWDEYQRLCIEKCQRCEYRERAREETT